MSHLKAGATAPHISGKDQNGNLFDLQSLRGKKVVLYFYPKDNTPGCTAQACNLRDNISELAARGFTVVGISPDSEKSHQNFIKKFDLPFTLIADTDKKIVQDYGVWGEKKMYGKPYMGVFRTTFILSENGIIESVIADVDTKDHTNQIFKQLSL
jgi:peroxiredoxin Q/BCP